MSPRDNAVEVAEGLGAQRLCPLPARRPLPKGLPAHVPPPPRLGPILQALQPFITDPTSAL